MSKKYILLKLLAIYAFIISPILFWIASDRFCPDKYIDILIFIYMIIFLFIPPGLLMYMAFYYHDYWFAKNRRVRRLKRKLVKKLSTVDDFLEVNIVYLDTYSTYNHKNTEIDLISYYMSHSSLWDTLDDSLLADCKLYVKFKDNTTLEIDFKICFDFDEDLLYLDDESYSELSFIKKVYKLCSKLEKYKICF